MRRGGFGLSRAFKRPGFNITATLSVSVAITGLGTAGVYSSAAIVGSHAGIGATVSDGSTITAYAWGSTLDGVEYGTGAAPANFAAGDTGNPNAPGTLYLTLTTNTGTYKTTAPIRAALPTISTNAAVSTTGTSLGDTITLTPAAMAGLPATYTRSLRLYSPDSDLATGNGTVQITHNITAAEDNELIDGEDIVTCSGGVVTSDATGQFTVDDFSVPTVTDDLAISGSATQGTVLSLTGGTVAGNPTPTVAYQWKRVSDDAVLGTGATYTVAAGDVGERIYATKQATNGLGSSALRQSAWTALITGPAPIARVFIPQNRGAGNLRIGLAGIRFLDANDVEIVPTGEYSASNEWNGNVAANAFDGNTGTEWLTSDALYEWVQARLPSGAQVAKVEITGSNTNSYSPADGILLQSDDNGSTFTPIIVWSDWAVWSALEVRTYADNRATNAAYRYFEIECLTPISGYQRALRELEFRESVGGADVSGAWTVTSVSDGSANPGFVINDIPTDAWVSNSWDNQNMILKFDAGAGNSHMIAEMLVRYDTLNRTPHGMILRGSTDDVTYHEIAYISEYLQNPAPDTNLIKTLDVITPASVNPDVTSLSFTAGSGGNPADLPMTYTYAGADQLEAVIALSNSGTPPSKAQMIAGTGGGVIESITADVADGVPVDLTGFTAAAEAATNAYLFLREKNNGGEDPNIETVAVSSLDFTNPVFSSAATNAAGTEVTVTFSEIIYGSPLVADMTVREDAVAAAISSITFTPGTNSMVLNMTSALSNGTTIDFSYDGTGDLEDAENNQLGAITQQSVTNNVAGAPSSTYVERHQAPASNNGTGGQYTIPTGSLPAGECLIFIKNQDDAGAKAVTVGSTTIHGNAVTLVPNSQKPLGGTESMVAVHATIAAGTGDLIVQFGSDTTRIIVEIFVLPSGTTFPNGAYDLTGDYTFNHDFGASTGRILMSSFMRHNSTLTITYDGATDVVKVGTDYSNEGGFMLNSAAESAVVSGARSGRVTASASGGTPWHTVHGAVAAVLP